MRSSGSQFDRERSASRRKADHLYLRSDWPFGAVPCLIFDRNLRRCGRNDLLRLPRRVSYHDIAEILRGAKPSDVPFCGPSCFELVINISTWRPRAGSNNPGTVVLCKRAGHERRLRRQV